MLKIRIIPCLDVKDGRVVKGINFLNLRDAGDPVEQAHYYSNNGADEICFLDISATLEKRETMISIVKKTAEKVFIPLTVGGGINSVENVRNLLNAGADKVSINTAAIKNPGLIKRSSRKFGNQCIVVAIDAKQIKKNKWEIYTHGGRKKTGIDAIKWARKMENFGAGEILLTSMDKDGTKSGFDLELTKKISNSINIPVIASGGVGNIQHLIDGIKIGKASAVLAASIFHYGKYTVRQVKYKMKQKGIAVRI